MTDVLVASQIILLIAVTGLLFMVIALARQIGVLHERTAPMGALITDSGPKVGEPSPVVESPNLAGGSFFVGEPRLKATLLFFVSPTCPVCKKLLPIARSIQSAERSWVDLVLASDGEMPEHQAFRTRAGISEYPYLLSQELGMRFRVSKLPYAVLIDPSGVIKAKGLVNNREQIESLFTANELGVTSIQEFITRSDAIGKNNFSGVENVELR